MADDATFRTAQINTAPMQPRNMGARGVTDYVTALSNAFSGRSNGESEQCVALVKATSNVGHTSNWAPGATIGANTAPGTPIATFGAGGVYENTPGRSHAAIYLGPGSTDGSIRVLDQWKGHAAGVREIPPGDRPESAQNFRAIAARDGSNPGLAQVPGMKFTTEDWAALGGGYGDGNARSTRAGASYATGETLPVDMAAVGGRRDRGTIGDPGDLTITESGGDTGGGGGFSAGSGDPVLSGGGGAPVDYASLGGDVWAQDDSGIKDINQRVDLQRQFEKGRIGEISPIGQIFDENTLANYGQAAKMPSLQRASV